MTKAEELKALVGMLANRVKLAPNEYWNALDVEQRALGEIDAQQSIIDGLHVTLAKQRDAIDKQKSIIDEQRAEIERLTKDAELLALVLASPETAAEELEDAAAGDGTPRENLERRLAGSPAELEGGV